MASSYSYVVQSILDRYGYLKPEQIRSRLHHSSFVNVAKRYMYYAVPKAACTSMKTLINSVEGGPPIKILSGRMDETRRDMFIHARENVAVPSLVDLDDAAQREVLHAPDFLRMTIVRNPYTRVLSAWNKVMLCQPGSEEQYLAIKGTLPAFTGKDLITLSEFVDYLATQDLRTCDAHWSYQHTHLFLDVLDFNLIGKTENMADVLQQFAQRLGRPEIAAERRNASHASSGAHYDPEIAKRVHELYAVDFERLGYRADDWPAGDPSAARVVPEQKYNDEIVERNLILSELYKEVFDLRDKMAKVDRLHLTGMIDALTTTRGTLRRILGR
jgi:Sulfotransferase family